MSERNYYVISDDNCLFPAMTKEQVLNAIAEATGETVTDIDEAFITMIKEKNGNRNLKFWVGTQAQYNAIQTPDDDVAYIITDADALGTLETKVAQNTESIIDIYQKTSTIADYIYDESDIDGWHIRKWVSGRVEAEKSIDITSYSYSSYAPLYHSGWKTFNYPSGLFSSVESVSIITNVPYIWTGGGGLGKDNTMTDFLSTTDSMYGRIIATIHTIGKGVS